MNSFPFKQILFFCFLLFGIQLVAMGGTVNDFKLTLLPIQIERHGAKEIFRIRVRLHYFGKAPIELNAGENVFFRTKAGFLERSTYFGSDPAFPLCSLRQVSPGVKYDLLSRKFVPGETLEEEWTTDGKDLNAASFDGKVLDGGYCIDKPGKYRIRAIFAAWTKSSELITSFPSNEQVLVK